LVNTMKVINVEKPFKHSDDGNTVTAYEVGKRAVSDRCAEVAVDQLEVAKLTKDDPEKFAAKLAEEKAKAAEK